MESSDTSSEEGHFPNLQQPEPADQLARAFQQQPSVMALLQARITSRAPFPEYQPPPLQHPAAVAAAVAQAHASAATDSSTDQPLLPPGYRPGMFSRRGRQIRRKKITDNSAEKQDDPYGHEINEFEPMSTDEEPRSSDLAFIDTRKRIKTKRRTSGSELEASLGSNYTSDQSGSKFHSSQAGSKFSWGN